MQTGASSNTANITQQYLKETFGRHFIRKDKWPSSSPDWNPLNYYFRDAVTKRYTRVIGNVFQSLAELKKRIRKVWEDAHGIVALSRAILKFRSKLQALVTKSDGPIKVHFG